MLVGAGIAVTLAIAAPQGATAQAAEIARLPSGTLSAMGLAGERVVLGLRTEVGHRVVSLGPWRTRVLLELRRPEPPPEIPEVDERPTVTDVVQMKTSAKRVAILRDVGIWWSPRCLPACRWGPPSRYEPLFTEVYVGTPAGRLRRIARVEYDGRPCAAAPSYLAVSGSTVAYATVTRTWYRCRTGAARSTVVVTGVGRRRVTALDSGTQITSLALAGPWVAWGERREGGCPCFAFVRREWRRGVTTLRYAKLRFSSPDELALQPNGTLALVLPIRRKGCGRREIAIVPPAARAPRFLGATAWAIAGIGRDRVVGFGPAECTSADGTIRLIASDLGGRVRVLRRAVDLYAVFDGTHVLYAVPEIRAAVTAATIVYRQRVP